jgi:uncharacterized membrane protein
MKEELVKTIVFEVIFLTIFFGAGAQETSEFISEEWKWGAMVFSGSIAVGLLIYYLWFRYVKHGGKK